MARPKSIQYVIVKLESYEGEDTFLRCGDENQDYMYAIVSIDTNGGAAIVDSSYRTEKEAATAWPEAVPRRMRAKN